MRVNYEIRAPKVRVIGATGEQLGVMTSQEALRAAHDAELDLVEVVATSTPPVCKIMDYGKFCYDQAKRKKESRRSQQQIRVKEIKISPNISEHDRNFKVRHAREFLEKGNKVKVTCVFRGREVMHPELGHKLMLGIIQEFEEMAIVETSPKMFGRVLTMVLAPNASKQKKPSGGVKPPRGQSLKGPLQEALSKQGE